MIIIKQSYWVLLILLYVASCVQSEEQNVSKAPFIQPDSLHLTRSQFQFNLILNENRHIPIFFVQYSKDWARQRVQHMIKGALRKQSGIAFAILVDCKQFQYNMNNTLRICNGFDAQKARLQQEEDLQIQQDKKQDRFFRFDFLAPNPSRIKEKGHQMTKNHDTQNLRQMNNLFNDQFLVKVLRNQIPDFISYIEDNYDMDEFLQTKSEFKSAKKAKILFFDQNLQAPLFLKKLAAVLYGKIKIGVTDNFKIAKKYDAFYDSVLLMEYNFVTNYYQTTKITFEEGNELKSCLNNKSLKRYSSIKRYRDILLDFEHKDSTIYNISSLSEVNQLITHGRIIILQVSSSSTGYDCQLLKQFVTKYQVFFNYICFSQSKVASLKQAGLNIQNTQNSFYIIDDSLKNSSKVHYDASSFNIYDHIPRVSPRQKISAQSEMQMCLKTAITSKRDPVIYWYNDKQNRNTLKLLQYFNSLSQVTSLVYFCQIYLPDEELVKRYQLQQNTLFSMINPSQRGQMQKLQFKQALEFVSIKMFLRQLSINQMLKVYEEKLSTNSINQITSAQDLTKECFNKQCIVGLMASTNFRFQSEIQTFKELKLQMSDTLYNFVWIDGHCHWDIAKQLKYIDKSQKQIDRSYIFYYKQKSNQYGLMKNIQANKYWVKKDVKKWLKNLKESDNIKRMKFGIDIEDKKCQKIASKQTNKKVNNQKNGQKRRTIKNQVKQGEL